MTGHCLRSGASDLLPSRRSCHIVPRMKTHPAPDVVAEATDSLLPPGGLAIGANYWASHAGTAMWSDWREEVVAADLGRLAAAGVTLLRVFPLWPDFQPIHRLYAGHGEPMGFARADGSPLPNREGLDPVMLDRFNRFCELAGERKLKLVVGLVTGWMSGRRFVPPGLAHLNPITDPLSMQWQVRLCRGIIRRAKHHRAVAAWDLGNECNVLGQTPSRAAAYAWTALLAGTIKAADPTRPLVSGMHSLHAGVADDAAGGDRSWRIDDQGELTDVLTTHPYAFWVEHAGNDPTDTLRPIVHAACETRLYADLSGKPCFAEEIGSMGPTVCDDGHSADFLRASAWSLWQHGGRAAMWWCAFDQDELTHPPYEWVAVERKLGLFRGDGSEKPALTALREVAEAVAGMPFGPLPPRRPDAAVILTPGQDSWAAAYGAWVLARQAGLDVVYATSETAIPELPLLIVPSATGLTAMRASFARELERRARAGARVLVSVDDAHVNDLDRVFGLHLARRYPRPAEDRLQTWFRNSTPEATSIPYASATRWKLELEPAGAEILAAEPDGNPVLTRHRPGGGNAGGEAWLLTFPIEAESAATPGALGLARKRNLGTVYRALADGVDTGRVATARHPHLGLSEHGLAADRRVLVAVNAGPDEAVADLGLASGWSVAAVHLGSHDAGALRVAAFDAAVLELARA